MVYWKKEEYRTRDEEIFGRCGGGSETDSGPFLRRKTKVNGKY